MIPQLLWMIALALAAALAWRAFTQGGPLADWIWQGLGLVGLAVFAGEAVNAWPVLIDAIAREDIWAPRPLLQWHVGAIALVMLVRPAAQVARVRR